MSEVVNLNSKRAKRLMKKARRRSKKGVFLAPVVEKVKQVKRRKKQRKREKSRSTPALAHVWADSLNDPFDNSPPRFGGGTMVPTGCATGYYKGSFTLTNGSGMIWLWTAGLNSGVSISSCACADAVGGSNLTVGLVNRGWANGTSLVAGFSASRIVSQGVRAFASIPGTGAPGQIVAGLYPDLYSLTTFNAANVSSYITSSNTVLAKGTKTVMSTWRPCDSDDMLMDPLLAGTSTTPRATSVPFIAFTGMAAATVVYFEAIVNVEGILSGSSASTGGSEESSEPWFQTDIAEMLQAAGRFVTSPTVVSAVYGAGRHYLKASSMNYMPNMTFKAARYPADAKESENKVRARVERVQETEEEGYFSPARPQRRVKLPDM